MGKVKYIEAKTIDYRMLDSKEVLGQKIIDIHLHSDYDVEELQLQLENGKQIEICLISNSVIHVQSD